MKRFVTSMVFVALVLTGAVALAQPSLTHAVPAAVTPGKTTEVTLHGAKLQDPLNIWTSFPAKVERVPPAAGKKDETKAIFKITVDQNVPVGVGGVIVATPAGVADTLFMLVDDLPSTQEAGSNQSLAAAQEVTLPTAIDGASQASGSDFFRFQAKAGQRISVEAVARRMGSPLDPVIWLRDEKGRELAYADDDESLGEDCRLGHTFEADGQYVVEIRDNGFQGGQRYRLRVGDFPLVTTAYPLGGQLGQPAKFEFAGQSIEGVVPTAVTLPATVGGSTTIGAKYSGGTSSALVTIAASSHPEAVEAEPNNEIAKATKVTLPCAVNGRIETDGDSDFFQFDAKKGQRFWFRGQSRSLGSPTYVSFRVTKADGSQLVASAVNDADEQSLGYTFPADGTYGLVVEDLLRRSGPEFTYRVAIEPSVGFSLELQHDAKADAGGNGFKILASTGQAFAIDVVSKRDGYNGPITLSVESPLGKFPLHNNVIAEKQNATKLIVEVPAELKAGTLAQIRVVGKATFNGQEVSASAATFAKLRAKWAHVTHPPAWHDGLLALAGATPLAPFFDVKSDVDAAYFARGVGKGGLTLTPERKNKDFKDGITVLVDGLPAKVTSAVKVNDKPPKDTYQITLTGPKDLAEGEHKIRILTYAELKGRGQKIVREIPLKVVTPLTVTVAPAGPLVVGKKQKVKVTVSRIPGASDPITLKWTKLPSGVTGPGDVTIAAATNQVILDVELTAAAEATVGQFKELTVQAITKFQGQDITAENKPASLDVKK